MGTSGRGTGTGGLSAGARGGAESAGVLHPARPRRVGPGRIERGWEERLRTSEARARRGDELLAGRERELELARRLERGAQRRLDRQEAALAEERARVERAGQRERRLILALGALQRENELLRERLELAAAPAPRLPAPRASASVGWSRWLRPLRRRERGA